MRAKLVLTALVAFPVASVNAQLSPVTFSGVPQWADSALRAAGLDQTFRFSSTLNPIYAFGDFDRDGLWDFAVEIVDTGGLRCGIAIVHRIDRSVHVVGAGRPLGNGRDALPRGGWAVASAHRSHRFRGFGPDLLYVADPAAHSGWLVWDQHSYVWIQADY
jgi:hypothetical protein